MQPTALDLTDEELVELADAAHQLSWDAREVMEGRDRLVARLPIGAVPSADEALTCLPNDDLAFIEEDAEEIADALRRDSRLRQRQRGESG
jgi:hypothetical protein